MLVCGYSAGSYVHISMGQFSGAVPIMVSFMQFSTNPDGYRTTTTFNKNLHNSYNSAVFYFPCTELFSLLLTFTEELYFGFNIGAEYTHELMTSR